MPCGLASMKTQTYVTRGRMRHCVAFGTGAAAQPTQRYGKLVHAGSFPNDLPKTQYLIWNRAPSAIITPKAKST